MLKIFDSLVYCNRHQISRANNIALTGTIKEKQTRLCQIQVSASAHQLLKHLVKGKRCIRQLEMAHKESKGLPSEPKVDFRITQHGVHLEIGCS
jgi:hypothetical protein